MSKRNRKRKLEADDDQENKEYSQILSDEFRDQMATMWEIPQIFHFLHMSKDVLHISHLSMYEMERMLAMPRASKQLANIMTCLLSPPLPKARMRKIPPMPYDFWVNVLTHKVKGWFKVYQSKHRDIVKVLEATGVEPEFWRIFPDVSVIDEKDFDRMSFKERIWIMKTLCDTIMHSRKSVHDEVTKQRTEEQCQVILGSDRYGAKYFWFPLFLNNDLRVYRHCIDNTILSTVKPPPWKEGQTPAPRPDKHGRNKRKRSRWKNGALPRDRRRSRKQQDDETKESRLESLVNEDTNFSGTSACSNNNNISVAAKDRTDSPSPSKTSSEDTGVLSSTIHCRNPKSSGYDTNTSSDAKSINGTEFEEMFRGFPSQIDNETSSDVICSVKELLDGVTSIVSEMVDGEENERLRDDDDDEYSRPPTIPERNFDSGSEDNAWSETSECRRDIGLLTAMLDDLSVSNFELVADSLESLRDLANSLLNNEVSEGRSRNNGVPRCELSLARTIEELIDSLKDVEPTLKESVRKARSKLQREWTNFKDGYGCRACMGSEAAVCCSVVEDEETPGNVDRGSNRWILGSQGPLPPTGDATLQTLSDAAVSPSGDKIKSRRSSSADSEDRTRFDDDTESAKDEKSNENIKSEDGKLEIKKEGSDVDDAKEEFEQENHRVLRRRGISSYTEQFSSSDEEAYELEEWPRVEAINATPSTSDGTPAAHSPTKTGQIGDESDEKNSDQDWILPSSRKRKNKRSAASRKLKTLQQKLQTLTGDSHDLNSTQSDRHTPELSANNGKTTKDGEKTEAPPICKMASIHSELDIKDEGPIFDYNRSGVHLTNVNESYVIPGENQPASSSLGYNVAKPPVASQPVVGILTPVQPGYYVQRPPNYYPPASNPRYLQYPYPPRYPYPPGPQPYPAAPPQNYMQYQTYGPMPPRGLYPSHPNHRNPINSPRHPSTTLYGARTPMKTAPNRMPTPRTLVPQNNPAYPAYRGTVVRPRNAINQQQQARWHAPRGNAVPSTARMPRASVPKQTNIRQPPASSQKTTSLILLSDSDDEIEMIVPEKQNSTVANTGQNRRIVAANKTRQVPGTVNQATGAARSKPKPVVTSEITVSKSRQVLSPQMIQRMSQGGISITPVKPQQTKQKGPENSDGTKLVVVVNETGSHYALSLPNGSKLILTPEQVAQIRASNGGKLVL